MLISSVSSNNISAEFRIFACLVKVKIKEDKISFERQKWQFQIKSNEKKLHMEFTSKEKELEFQMEQKEKDLKFQQEEKEKDWSLEEKKDKMAMIVAIMGSKYSMEEIAQIAKFFGLN